MYLVANSFSHSLASGFYLFLSYGYSIRNYEHCRKLMKLQRILLGCGLRKSVGKVQLYNRELGYVKFISAIFQIYQRNSNYIGDFHNISAQFELYQRFFDYIDLPTKTTKEEAVSKQPLPLFRKLHPNSSPFPFRAIYRNVSVMQFNNLLHNR